MVFFNNKFNTFFGLNLTLVYTFPMCMAWRFHFPIRNYDFNDVIPQKLRCASHLLDKLVKRDFLNTLVVNLYPGNEGYSLMIKGRNGCNSETIKLPYEVRIMAGVSCSWFSRHGLVSSRRKWKKSVYSRRNWNKREDIGRIRKNWKKLNMWWECLFIASFV